jgi:hypothetical protein
MMTEVMLRERLGELLPEGVALHAKDDSAYRFKWLWRLDLLSRINGLSRKNY